MSRVRRLQNTASFMVLVERSVHMPIVRLEEADLLPHPPGIGTAGASVTDEGSGSEKHPAGCASPFKRERLDGKGRAYRGLTFYDDLSLYLI
ncbi:hypothetical protein J6590_050483 [Homalodisca vitripennis]|nr:hypothetical protein J6590_050483 [Homalodisca vitripennis]